MARPHVDLVNRALVAEVDPDRLHEAQRPADLVGDHLVAPALERAGDELLVPGVHLGQVGEAALREGTQQIERRDGLVVGLHEPLGIGRPRLDGRLVGVNGVAAERRQLHPVDHLGRRRPRLRVLARQPADLDHRQRRAVGHHGRHLEQQLEPLPDRDHGELVERLGAVARLEQERPALGGLAELVPERPRLAGEDQRRQPAEPLADRLERSRVGPVGLLQRRKLVPGGGRPGRIGHCHGNQCSRARFDATPGNG